MTDQLRDVIRRATRSGGPCFTHFLDPASGAEFLGVARQEGLSGGGFGGASDAERAVYACWADGREPPDWPVRCLSIRWSERAGTLGHRDVLGAVLGLGVSRDHIGDVRAAPHEAWLAAEEAVAAYIEGNLEQAGRVSVKVAPAQAAPEREGGARRTVSVSSARLDALLAAALGCSRARAQEVIRSGKVQVGWREELRPDRETAPGDVLSVRGAGRVCVGETCGTGRKGRLHINIETFLGKNP